MKALIIVEHDNHHAKQVNFHILKAVQQISQSIDLLVIGYQCQEVVKNLQNLSAIKCIRVADNQVYQHQLAENSAELISKLAQEYDYVVTGATTFGKNLLPRAAALLDVDMISDVVKIVSANTFIRPIYAGNALATIESNEKIKLLTIRGTAFAAEVSQKADPAAIENLNIEIADELVTFESHQLTESSRPELTSAKIIISGGRAFKSAENFKMLEGLADILGAAIGASRAAVDAGFAPNDYQVGQTGKIVAPDLYIAIGISGAIQHMAGMKDSKIVVAINNDPDAPIFQMADYGVVGDLFKLLPELRSLLAK